MKTEELRRRLDDQDWECAYCGKTIEEGTTICRCFDNHGIAHLECHAMGTAPSRT